MNECLQLLYAILSSMGFAFLYNLKCKRLITAGIGGLVCWGVYLLSMNFFENIFLSAFLSALSCGLYAEISARILKAPSTVFVTPAVIPLVPGGLLYYTMQYAVLNDWQLCKQYAWETVLYVGAITAGLSLVSAIFKLLFTRKKV